MGFLFLISGAGYVAKELDFKFYLMLIKLDLSKPL